MRICTSLYQNPTPKLLEHGQVFVHVEVVESGCSFVGYQTVKANITTTGSSSAVSSSVYM